MKYLPLIETCKKAIATKKCTGCQALENPYFVGNKDCEFAKQPTAQESIGQIHKILGIQEKMWK